jgi:hypothetical protein
MVDEVTEIKLNGGTVLTGGTMAGSVKLPGEIIYNPLVLSGIAQVTSISTTGVSTSVAESKPDFTEEQLKSLIRIRKAIEVTDGDTLGRVNMGDKVIWTARGSWSQPHSVTIGDLINALAFIESKLGVKI